MTDPLTALKAEKAQVLAISSRKYYCQSCLQENPDMYDGYTCCCNELQLRGDDEWLKDSIRFTLESINNAIANLTKKSLVNELTTGKVIQFRGSRTAPAGEYRVYGDFKTRRQAKKAKIDGTAVVKHEGWYYLIIR